MYPSQVTSWLTTYLPSHVEEAISGPLQSCCFHLGAAPHFEITKPDLKKARFVANRTALGIAAPHRFTIKVIDRQEGFVRLHPKTLKHDRNEMHGFAGTLMTILDFPSSGFGVPCSSRGIN